MALLLPVPSENSRRLRGPFVASRLVFRGSFVELLPESAREVQDLKAVSQKAGGDGYLVLQATGVALPELQAFAVALPGKPYLAVRVRRVRA